MSCPVHRRQGAAFLLVPALLGRQRSMEVRASWRGPPSACFYAGGAPAIKRVRQEVRARLIGRGRAVGREHHVRARDAQRAVLRLQRDDADVGRVRLWAMRGYMRLGGNTGTQSLGVNTDVLQHSQTQLARCMQPVQAARPQA
jgi:hypothetical protein